MKSAPVIIRVEPKKRKRWKLEAVRREVSLTSLIEQAVDEFFSTKTK